MKERLMQDKVKNKIIKFLRWSEKYTKTDMVYVFRGVFWLNIGRIGIAILTIGLMSAFARFTPKEVFGSYQYILSVVGILLVFSLPGINNALIRAVAQGKEGDFTAAAKEKIKWAALGSVVLVIISLWYLYNGNLPLGIAFLISSFFTPFLRTSEMFTTLWHGRADFKKQSMLEFLGTLFPVAILILAVTLTNSIIYLILVYFISHSVIKGILFLYTKKKIRNKEKDIHTIPFGKHLTLMSVVGTIVGQIDKIMLWHFLGPIPVAIYSFAKLPIERLGTLIPIQQLALPKLSQRNLKEIKGNIISKVVKLSLLLVPFIIFLILLAPFFYKLLFPAYIDSVIYFQILALGLIFIPTSIFGIGLMTELRKRELYIMTTISPVIKLVAYIVLIPLYGIWGAIFSHLIFQAIWSLLAFYFFKKM